jgi:hypothetical protein
VRTSSESEILAAWSGARQCGAIRLEQADHRRLPCWRGAIRWLCSALAQAVGPRCHRVIAHRLMGAWQPTAESFQPPGHPPIPAIPTSRSPIPFFLALRAGGRAGRSGRCVAVAFGMEVGWNPFADHPPRGTGVHLVARRGSDHGTLSGARTGLHHASGRRRPGWRDPARGRMERPLPFAQLQRRIGRRKLTARRFSRKCQSF